MAPVVPLLSASQARLALSVRDRITLCKVMDVRYGLLQGADDIVDYAIDWAIVQTQKWNTLYILSRERQPASASIDASTMDTV